MGHITRLRDSSKQLIKVRGKYYDIYKITLVKKGK